MGPQTSTHLPIMPFSVSELDTVRPRCSWGCFITRCEMHQPKCSQNPRPTYAWHYCGFFSWISLKWKTPSRAICMIFYVSPSESANATGTVLGPTSWNVLREAFGVILRCRLVKCVKCFNQNNHDDGLISVNELTLTALNNDPLYYIHVWCIVRHCDIDWSL